MSFMLRELSMGMWGLVQGRGNLALSQDGDSRDIAGGSKARWS